MSYVGISSYPRNLDGSYSTAIIDQIVAVMNSEGLNVYRMAIGNTVDATPYIRYFLDHCSYDLILDYYHGSGGYPPANVTQAQVDDSISKALGYLATFGSYSRFWVEPLNERTNTDLPVYIQQIVTAIRNAGYTNKILYCDSHGTATWTEWKAIDNADPLHNFWTGGHPYFNSTTLSAAETRYTNALNAGLKIVNTEVGANYNEANAFTQQQVNDLNSFLAWSAPKGVGNTVWMRYGLENYPKYQSMGLDFPTSVTPPTPVTLPYHNPFVNLDDLSVINGIWSVT